MYIPKESCSFLSNINSVCMDILKSLEIENVHSIEYVVINNVETSAKTKFVIWYTLGFPDNEEPYITNQVVEIYVEDLIEENFPINHYKRLKKKYIDTYNKRIERERKISEAQRIKEEKEPPKMLFKQEDILETKLVKMYKLKDGSVYFMDV